MAEETTEGQEPCPECLGFHGAGVHTIEGSLGDSTGGAPAPAAAPLAGDVDLYVDLDGLHSGGRRLFVAGEDLSTRVEGTLAVIESLGAAMVAGVDKTGRTFHQDSDGNPGYDTLAKNTIESVRAFPEGYKAHGYLAQAAAKAYADVDDANGANTRQYLGIWGGEPEGEQPA